MTTAVFVNKMSLSPSPIDAARLLARRALEMLLFLERHSTRIALRVPAIAVTADDAREAVEAECGGGYDRGRRDPKGKRPRRGDSPPGTGDGSGSTGAVVDVPEASEAGDAGADGRDSGIALLLRALASPAFVPHVGLVELILQTLETSLRFCASERRRRVTELAQYHLSLNAEKEEEDAADEEDGAPPRDRPFQNLEPLLARRPAGDRIESALSSGPSGLPSLAQALPATLAATG